jgi:membrane peptidoglycan carboxypeptidase
MLSHPPLARFLRRLVSIDDMNATSEPTTNSNRRPARRWLAGAAAAIGAGALIAVPLTVAAHDDDGETWVSEALSGLVEDGTITQEQADAVSQALVDARPEREFGRGRGPGHWFARGLGLDEAAESIGVDVDDLREALRGGQTIAEVAAEHGVDVQAVIDAMVAEAEERINEAVTDGRLDETEAAERLADVTEKITTFVNEGFPERDGD